MRDYADLYANINIRIVYLHLCLAAGYHDDDRDICNDSIRQLSRHCHITVSATRNALQQLTKAGLLQRESDSLRVTKWVMQKQISKRATSTMSDNTQANLAEIRRREAEKRDAEERKYLQRRAELEEQGIDERELAMITIIAKACAGDAKSQDVCKRHKWRYAAQYTQDDIYKGLVKIKAAAGHAKCIEICRKNKWRYEQKKPQPNEKKAGPDS